MGANVSTQQNESISNIVNNALTEVSTSIKNGNKTYTTSIQNMIIDASGLKTSGDFVVNQTTSIDITTILDVSNNLSNDLANKLTAEINKKLEASIAQANEDLNLGQLNIANTSNISKTNTVNNVSNAIKTAISNSVETNTYSNQKMVVLLKNADIGGNVDITSETIIKVLSKNIADQITKTAISNALDNKVIEEIINKVDQKNAGVDIMAILTAIGIGVVCVGGVYVYVMFGGSGEQQPTNISTGGFFPQLDKNNTYFGGDDKLLDIELDNRSIFLGVFIVLFILLMIFEYWQFINYKKLTSNDIYMAYSKKRGLPINIFNYIL